MPKSIDWIPTRFEAFNDKLDVYFAKVVINKVAWGIPDAAITPLLILQAEFVGLYSGNKRDRPHILHHLILLRRKASFSGFDAILICR